MYTIIAKARFEAAHDIPGYNGKCARLHGHSYRVEAEFTSSDLNKLGMVHDLAELKDILNQFLPDHVYLNDILPFSTTVENVSRWVFDQLKARDLPVSAVTVWETENSGCRYTPG